MRTTISATAALLMLGTAASAADMRPLTYQPPPMMAAPTWAGFYLGVNVGGAFGTAQNDFSVAGGANFASIDHAFSGFSGGGQIGYNWQFSSFVLGLEADFQGSTLKGTLNAPCPLLVCGPAGLSAAYSQSIPWWGTARARVGYAQDSWLFYVTGGYAFANHETTGTATAGPLVASFTTSELRNGWTIGTGIEVGFSRNWSAKLEYLYVDLGTARNTWGVGAIPLVTHDDRVTMNVVRLGLNYRF